MTDPVWLSRARSYLGTRERPGLETEPRIRRWLERLKAPWRDDETAWCGSFVGGVLDECGLPYAPNPWAARAWLGYGYALRRPAVGCIAVFWRVSPDGWAGHVGFVVGQDEAGNLMVLGGNQGDAVTIKAFPRMRVLGFCWPPGGGVPEDYALPVLERADVSRSEA